MTTNIHYINLSKIVQIGWSHHVDFCVWTNRPLLLAKGVECSKLLHRKPFLKHYADIIMTTMASQITSLTVVYSTVYSDTDQRKHQSSASLAFVWGSHRDRCYAENVSIWWRHHDTKGNLYLQVWVSFERSMCDLYFTHEDVTKHFPRY